MGRCYPCDENVPDPELLNHLRVYHPDDVPELWPDGEPQVSVPGDGDDEDTDEYCSFWDDYWERHDDDDIDQ